MTSPQSLTLGAITLFFSSCALEVAEESPTAASSPEQIVAPEPEAIVEAPLIQEIGFADPNTTAKLITQEETKTIVGAPPKQNPERTEDDNAVNVTIPPLPDAQLPDDSSN